VDHQTARPPARAANDTNGIRVPDAAHRYPLQPLADAMGLSLAAACRALGVSGSTMQDYRHRGLTERVADRLAVRAGFHPAEVWPDWGHRVCDNELCGATFLPERNGQRFCTPICRRRTASRRWHNERYANDPAFAAQKRADQARRRAEAGPAARRAEAARKRASYARHAVAVNTRRRVRYQAAKEGT